MDTIVSALAEQHAELASLIMGLDESGWRTPSRCAGWTVADVIIHLAQTDEIAIASTEGRFGEHLEALAQGAGPGPGPVSVDQGADLLVARERDTPGAQIGARWQASADEMRARLLRCDPSARLTWITGELSARTLATTRLAECWIHTGDVAGPLGHEPAPSERLWHIARLAWRTLPYAFASAGRSLHGPVAFELLGPSGDRWDFSDGEPATVIRGDGHELCLVAGRRIAGADSTLTGEGPDADDVLELVRTYA